MGEGKGEGGRGDRRDGGKEEGGVGNGDKERDEVRGNEER